MTLLVSILIGSSKFFSACKDSVPEKEPPLSDSILLPKLKTMEVINITRNAASCRYHVFSKGLTNVINKGICWSKNPQPTINDFKTTDGQDTGMVLSLLTGLTENSVYYIRAYAINSEGTAYGNELNFTTASNPIALGKTYQGGIIFYIDGSGQHGLIAAPKDQGYAKWGCQGLDVVATSTALGKGDQSTYMIVNQCTALNTAAKICYELTLNGYSDWYLPTKDELKLLHQNLYLKGIGDLKLDTYWSSSQANKTSAWKQLFNQNLNQGYYDKDLISYAVRAVRSF
jgi:hypothetical protein